MANPEHLEVLRSGSEAWKTWRRKNPATIPDFSGADLARQDFARLDLTLANFGGANLTLANFHEAEATHANFNYANLDHAGFDFAELKGAQFGWVYASCTNFRRARLNSADLRDGNFSFSTLIEADLRNAVLWGTYFNSSMLKGADLTDARLTQTVFANVDLSEAKGLERVNHGGPSFLTVETLVRSMGRIPNLFLRGCGLPESWIQLLPSVVNQPNQFFSCFISYSHLDKAFAQLLHQRLEEKGIRCWLDEHQLLPGDDLHDRIDQGIRLWDKVLLCASRSSLSSWWVDGEINRTFQKEAEIMKERGRKILALIPLNLDGFLFSEDYASGKKSEIKSRVAANFVGWKNDRALFDRELENVIRALRSDEACRENPPKSKL